MSKRPEVHRHQDQCEGATTRKELSTSAQSGGGEGNSSKEMGDKLSKRSRSGSRKRASAWSARYTQQPDESSDEETVEEETEETEIDGPTSTKSEEEEETMDDVFKETMMRKLMTWSSNAETLLESKYDDEIQEGLIAVQLIDGWRKKLGRASFYQWEILASLERALSEKAPRVLIGAGLEDLTKVFETLALGKQ
ncbi:hypothetical protein [Nyavirus gerbillisci]|uniref:Uncharacterized protein n=1 Tax=Toure nyavirus TaxID=2994001 RepID=A0A9E8DA23_9MONO|nr:hypothetical protein [Toure nyavirus]